MTTADQPAGAPSRLAANRASKRAPGKWRSWETTEGAIRAPHRSMMRAMGLSDRDIDLPFVGVASTHNEVTPCNIGIAPLAEAIKAGVRDGDGTPFMFSTITVSDAISMGTEGMKGSLVSREIIADSIETVIFAERFDGLVAVAGCDKSQPGAMMAIARLNVPSVYVYGGSILPGNWRGKDIQIQDMFEAVGQHQAGAQAELGEMRLCRVLLPQIPAAITRRKHGSKTHVDPLSRVTKRDIGIRRRRTSDAEHQEDE